MASPMKSLFGGGSDSSSMMLPLMMMAMQGPTEAPPAPAQSPMGSPSQFKSGSGGSPSFVGAAATAPQQANLGGKTLLGQ